MVEVIRNLPVGPEQGFSVLADGWAFAGWVVGASHIRAVDESWPDRGSRIHHSIGPWPVTIEDVTTVTAVRPNSMIKIDSRLWPIGAVRVEIVLLPRPGGGTQVVLTEEIVKGPGKLAPQPLQSVLLQPTGTESLRRLEDIAVGRANRWPA
jgi:hypothetical protein